MRGLKQFPKIYSWRLRLDTVQTETLKKGNLTLVKGEMPLKSAETMSLKDMARQDPEVLEFFRIIHEHDMREKALELLERRMSRKDS